MNSDFNKIVGMERRVPVVATTQSIRVQAGKEIKEIKNKLKLEGFNDNDINNRGGDIFGGMGSVDSCMANFFLFSMLSFATYGVSPALIGTVLASVEGVSMVADNEFASRVEKSAMYPEGRNYFIISDRSLMDEFDLVAPKKVKRVAHGDKIKLDAAYKILNMVHKLEKQGVCYIPLSEDHSDIYDAVKGKEDYLSNSGIFAKGNTVTMH